MSHAMSPPAPPLRSRRRVRAGWSLLTAGALVAASAIGTAAPAQAAPGDASGLGLGVNVELDLGGEEILAINQGIARTSAPEGGGTDADSLVEIPIDEEFLGLNVEVISSEATRAEDGSDANAAIARANLRLGDVEILDARVLEATAVCPADGDPTADAQLASLTLLDENVNLDADAPQQVRVPVELDIPDVLEAVAIVDVRQVEEANGDSARATALIVDIDLELILADNDVVRVSLGELVFADARCESPDGAGTGTDAGDADADGIDADGTDADGTDADGTDADGTDGDDAGVLPDIDGDGDGTDADGTDADGTDADGTDADGTDADGTDADGFPGLDDVDDADGPRADSLDPDSGPTEGGTTVIVDGEGLDQTETVTVDGNEVDFEVNDDGTELTFVTPPGEAGTVDVVLTYDDGSEDTLQFTYTDGDGTDADAGTDTDGTAVLGETLEADGSTDGGTSAAGTSGSLAVTGAQQAPATAALALLLLAGGAWLLAWRERGIPVS
jgi:hypothetical protein